MKRKNKRMKSINIMELISENNINGIIKNLNKKMLENPIHLDLYLIHYAGYLNRLDLLKAILKKNTKWDYINDNGFTIAHIASTKGYCEILSFLYNKYGEEILEKLDKKGNNILFYLIDFPQCLSIFKKNHLKKYINVINSFNMTPLTIAINKLAENIEIIIENSITSFRQINIKKYKHNYDEDNIYLKTIDILLENDVDIDIKIYEPALLLATKFNITNIVKKFIKAKCDINIKDKGGKCALGWAVYNCNFELVKDFIKLKADINSFSHMGEAFIPLIALEYATNEIIEYIFKQNIDYNFTDYNRNTLGHIIALYGNEYLIDIIRIIINNTKNLNVKNLDGNTIAMFLWNLPYPKLEKLTDILINKRIDIYIKNNQGNNLLSNIYDDKFKELLDHIVIKGLEKQFKEKIYIKSNNSDPYDLIYNQKISYLKTKEEEQEEELENSIQLKEYTYINYNLFKNWYFDDIIMYVLIYLRNSKNLTMLYNEKTDVIFINEFKNIENFKTKMINEHYSFIMFYFPEFISIDIIWFDKDHYVFTESHEIAFKKALSKPQRFIFIMLGFFLSESLNGHANILLYDKEMKILERFDPEGIINLDILNDMDNFLKDKFKKIIDNQDFTYISPKDYGIINSFQKLSDEVNSLKRKVGDVKGFCQAWVFWYVEMRILNKNIHPIKLVNKLINRLSSMNISILEYIRNYANDLRKDVNTLMINSGISERIVNNEKYSEQVYKIIANKLLFLVQESF